MATGDGDMRPPMATRPKLRAEFWLGSAALCVGVLVYLVDRSPAELLACAYLTCPDVPLRIPIGDSWPSLLHCFAFSLVSVALLAPRGPTGAMAICGYWVALSLVIESLQAWEGSYFAGTFAMDDVVAIVVGGLLALLATWQLHARRRGVRE